MNRCIKEGREEHSNTGNGKWKTHQAVGPSGAQRVREAEQERKSDWRQGPDMGPGGCAGPARTLAFPLSDMGGQHCCWQTDLSFQRLSLVTGWRIDLRSEGQGERPVSRLCH